MRLNVHLGMNATVTTQTLEKKSQKSIVLNACYENRTPTHEEDFV